MYFKYFLVFVKRCNEKTKSDWDFMKRGGRENEKAVF